MTLSICNYKKIHICIVVAQDFQVSNSGSWEPLVLEPLWNPTLTNFWIREDWKIFFNRNIYFIFRIKLFIFHIGQIKLFIFIFVVFSILDWSKSEGLNFFFLHLRDQNIYFQHTPGQNIYLKTLPSPPPSKSNGRPLSQNVIWLYSLSVQRGRIEYEGETSV